jgi:divalent metal cation (Fe/Co/Zn/Cd) transporter
VRPREAALAVAIRLSFVTIAWNVVGGTIAVASAIVYDSLSLAAFGLSMLIDTGASVALVWRFRREERDPEGADRVEARAEVAIGIAMACAALYLFGQSAHSLWHGSHPGTAPPGIVVSVASLLFLPWLARAKWRVAAELGSNALRGDSLLTAASATLAGLTLAALLLYSALGWWWADAVAAAVIAGALLFEATRAAAYRRGLVSPRPARASPPPAGRDPSP